VCLKAWQKARVGSWERSGSSYAMRKLSTWAEPVPKGPESPRPVRSRWQGLLEGLVTGLADADIL